MNIATSGVLTPLSQMLVNHLEEVSQNGTHPLPWSAGTGDNANKVVDVNGTPVLDCASPENAAARAEWANEFLSGSDEL